MPWNARKAILIQNLCVSQCLRKRSKPPLQLSDRLTRSACTREYHKGARGAEKSQFTPEYIAEFALNNEKPLLSRKRLNRVWLLMVE
jgi:hypothetical protein